jgi:hypothetical protein
MALLTERQQKAADLAREIHRMGAWVTNVMPLDDNARGLRFQVLDADRSRIIQTLTDWEWSPIFAGTLPRVCPDGFKLASIFEIDTCPVSGNPLPMTEQSGARLPAAGRSLTRRVS